MGDDEKSKTFKMGHMSPCRSAYVEAGGQNCAKHLFQMVRNLTDNVLDRAPIGIALDEEEKAVEVLGGEIRFEAIKVEPLNKGDAPNNLGDKIT